METIVELDPNMLVLEDTVRGCFIAIGMDRRQLYNIGHLFAAKHFTVRGLTANERRTLMRRQLNNMRGAS